VALPPKNILDITSKGSIEWNALIVIPDGRLAFISANKF
jgi:hypothetical protein